MDLLNLLRTGPFYLDGGMGTLLQAAGLLEQTMAVAGERIDYYLNYRAKGQITIGAAVFSNETGMLCTTGPAAQWLAELEAAEPTRE